MLKLAAARVEAVSQVLAVGAPCAWFEQPPAGRAFWSVPETREALAAIMRPMTAAQAEPAPELVAQRFAVLQEPGYREYFAGIVAGDGSAQLAQTELAPEEAAKIACPVTLVYGRQGPRLSAAGNPALYRGIIARGRYAAAWRLRP